MSYAQKAGVSMTVYMIYTALITLAELSVYVVYTEYQYLRSCELIVRDFFPHCL
jgi:hypothetical protein